MCPNLCPSTGFAVVRASGPSVEVMAREGLGLNGRYGTRTCDLRYVKREAHTRQQPPAPFINDFGLVATASDHERQRVL